MKKRDTLETLLWRLDKFLEHGNCVLRRQDCKAVPKLWSKLYDAYMDLLDERQALQRLGHKTIPWEVAKKKLSLRARVAGGGSEKT